MQCPPTLSSWLKILACSCRPSCGVGKTLQALRHALDQRSKSRFWTSVLWSTSGQKSTRQKAWPLKFRRNTSTPASSFIEWQALSTCKASDPSDWWKSAPGRTCRPSLDSPRRTLQSNRCPQANHGALSWCYVCGGTPATSSSIIQATYMEA